MINWKKKIVNQVVSITFTCTWPELPPTCICIPEMCYPKTNSTTKIGRAASTVLGYREESWDKSAPSTSQLIAESTALSMCPWEQFHLHLHIGLNLNKFKLRSGLKERFPPSIWMSKIQSDAQTRPLVIAKHSWHDCLMSHFQNS